MIFFNMLFLMFSFMCLQAIELNPTGLKISDLDIIGSYRMMTGLPIKPETFCMIKMYSSKFSWSLTDLGKYIFSLNESRNFLKIISSNYDSLINNFDLSTVNISSNDFFNNLANYNKLQCFNTEGIILDNDLIASHRVFRGSLINQNDLDQYISIKNAVNNFDFMAFIFLGFRETIVNLSISSLKYSKEIELKMNNGLTLFGYENDYALSQNIKKYGHWEHNVEMFIRDNLKNGQIAIDVGSNIGYHGLVMAELVGGEGNAFLFEPVSELVSLINKAKSYNNLPQLNVECCAIADIKYNALFFVNPVCPAWSSFIAPDVAKYFESIRPGSVIEVPVKTLDDIFLEKNISVDLIKIDVEGAEQAVIQGAKKIIEKYKPTIIIEFNTASYKDIPNFIDYFIKLNYEIIELENNTSFRDVNLFLDYAYSSKFQHFDIGLKKINIL